MTKKYNYSTIKKTGDQLTATEWNYLTQDVEAAIDAIDEGTGESSDDSHIIFDERSDSNPTGKGNLTIQTTAEDLFTENNKTKGGKINIEPINDLQIKPGDDISLCSHHREDPTEVSVKVLDGNDNPVKLLLNAANIVLTTKDKNKTKTKDDNGSDTDVALYEDPTVMNVTVNSAKDTRGYLKVRAQAIDLRCEDHGGVALQPKGYDNPNGTKFDGDPTITADDTSNNRVRYMNKIKFEHGGGDGLEFGTFNTEKTSLYTNEYRFKKDGVWKMATRTPIARATTGDSKYKANDPTTHYYYLKQADDFYDVINGNDVTATTEQIITVANKLNVDTRLVKVAGKSVPSTYNITEVTLSDIDDDSDFVFQSASSTDLPTTGTNIKYGPAKIYELLDLTEVNDTNNLVDLLVGGSEVIVTYVVESSPHSYKFKKAPNNIIEDLIELVDYFKTGAGQANGPWAN